MSASSRSASRSYRAGRIVHQSEEWVASSPSALGKDHGRLLGEGVAHRGGVTLHELHVQLLEGDTRGFQPVQGGAAVRAGQQVVVAEGVLVQDVLSWPADHVVDEQL